MAFSSAGQRLTMLFWILRGVIQGCPLSGCLFAIAADPQLRALHSVVSPAVPVPNGVRAGDKTTPTCIPKGILCACADDIGGVLAHIRTLIPLAATFKLIQAVSGLALNPSKMFLFLLGTPLNNFWRDFVHTWLRRWIPDWANMKVTSAAVYLGFYLGPGARAHLWEKVTLKWLSRTTTLGKVPVAPSITVKSYNIRSITVLGYIAQLVTLPADIAKKDKWTMETILGLVPNSLTKAGLQQLYWLGCNDIVPVEIYAWASLVRTAISTLPSWSLYAQLYQTHLGETFPLSDIYGHVAQPTFWDALPYFSDLQAASTATHINSKLANITAAVITEHGRLRPRFAPRFRPQAEIIRRARDLQRHSIASTLVDRLNRLPGIHLQTGDVTFFLEQLPNTMKPVGHYIRLAYIKTLFNSWHTSKRMSEPTYQSCLFGCSESRRCAPSGTFWDTAGDDLSHYMICPKLWRWIDPRDSADADSILSRLGIPYCSVDILKRIAMAHHMYHTRKFSGVTDAAVLARKARAACGCG